MMLKSNPGFSTFPRTMPANPTNRSNLPVGQPVDQPKMIRPGVMHAEADAPGNSKWYALPPEHPERAAKGDLGELVMPGFESKPLSHPGLPFAGLRKE
jgi:hypothetical protein